MRWVFDKLGFDIFWDKGVVTVKRNGKVMGQFRTLSDLKVPSKKGVCRRDEPQIKPNAIFYRENGTRYYYFPRLGITVRLKDGNYDDEKHPPEDIFGKETSSEIERKIIGIMIEKLRKQYKIKRVDKLCTILPEDLVSQLSTRFDVKIEGVI